MRLQTGGASTCKLTNQTSVAGNEGVTCSAMSLAWQSMMMEVVQRLNSVRLGLLCAVLRAARDSVANSTLCHACQYLSPITQKEPRLTRSIAPLTRWYLTPGQSCDLPPLTSTTECCWTLCPCKSVSTYIPRLKCLHLLTFSWNVCRDNLPTAQPDPRNLALPRVGLLRLRRTHTQAHTLHLRSVGQRW